MFIASRKSKSKIFHEEHCPYAQRISERNRIYFAMADDALRAGYSPCKHCSVIFQAFRKEKEALHTYCQKHGIHMAVQNHRLCIRTGHSRWLLAPGKEKSLRLFHKNEENRLTNALEKRFPGYHEQRAHCGSILAYLQYIVRHDAYKQHEAALKTLPPVPKKGTKRYRKWLKQEKARSRRHQIGNVLSLIECLSSPV